MVRKQYMKLIIQSYRTGELRFEERPEPQLLPRMILVETKASVISVGTDKMLVDLANKSFIGKVRIRPDLVMKVIASASQEWIVNTLHKVRGKLDTPYPLGYSCSGIVSRVGEQVDEFLVGDLVDCGGASHANHARFNLVPKKLCLRILTGVRGAPEHFP